MQPPPNIDELLTGLLDGNLSELELRQVEAAMAVDSTLEKQLESLRKMRSDLLAHRPKGRLGPDFAKRVIAMAEERGRANAAPPSNPGPTPRLQLAPWIYSGAVSAAVVVCLFLMIPSAPKVQPLIATRDVPAENRADSPGEIPGVGPLESELNVADALVVDALIADSAIRKPKAPTVSQETGIKELEQSNSLVGVLPSARNGDDPKKDLVGNSTQNEDPATPKVASLSSDKRPNEQMINNAISKLDANLRTKKFLALVVDVSVTKSAMENETLESILSRHTIAMTEEQILTAEELADLEKTSLATKAAGEGSGEVGLVFLRAPGTNVNKAILEILQDQQSFPDVGMDIQMDDSLKFLAKELSQIRVVPERQGEARRLRSSENDSVLSFAAGSKKVPAMNPKARTSGMSAILKSETRAMSNVLLLIRPAK